MVIYLKLIYNNIIYNINKYIMVKLNDKILVDILKIKNDTIELLNKIDNYEITIINVTNENENKINKYKLMLENLIIEYHKTCNQIY